VPIPKVVGSSLLFAHDSNANLGVWMIDFCNTDPLPAGVEINHCSKVNTMIRPTRGIQHGVSKEVEDGCRPPALQWKILTLLIRSNEIYNRLAGGQLPDD
jgi:hypothetical protein